VDVASRRILPVDRVPGADDRELFDRAIKEKVSFVLAAPSSSIGGHEFARLAFSGISHEQIEQGIVRSPRRFATDINDPPINTDYKRPMPASAGSSSLARAKPSAGRSQFCR
jgi:hypothetical protein